MSHQSRGERTGAAGCGLAGDTIIPKTSFRGRVRAMPAGGTACREMRLTISVSVPAALSRSIWYAGQQEHGVVPGGAWRGCTHAPPDSQS